MEKQTWKQGGKLCLGRERSIWRTQRVFFRSEIFLIEREETAVEAPPLRSEHNFRNEKGNGKQITKMSSLSFEKKISKWSWSLGRGPQGTILTGKPLACKTGKTLGGNPVTPHHLWSSFSNEPSSYSIWLKIRTGVNSQFVIDESLWRISDIFFLSSSLMWCINWFSLLLSLFSDLYNRALCFPKVISMKCDLQCLQLCVL